jgi:hypothetical protein
MTTSIANLTSVERNLLDLVPDEEQRSVLYCGKNFHQLRHGRPAGKDGRPAGSVIRVTVNYEDVFGTAGVSSALQSIALGLQQPLPMQAQAPVPVPAGSSSSSASPPSFRILIGHDE